MNELYRHFDADEQLLYIGISGSSIRRFFGHVRQSPWADQVATIRIERFPTRIATQIAEIKAIIAEKPRHNVLHPNAEKMLVTLEADIKASSRGVESLRDLTGPDPEGTWGRKNYLTKYPKRMAHLQKLYDAGDFYLEKRAAGGFKFKGMTAKEITVEMNAPKVRGDAPEITNEETIRRWGREGCDGLNK